MMNTESSSSPAEDDAAVQAVLRSGSSGAIVLAGLATGTVVALWLAFYLFVFLPRAAAS